MADSLPVLGCAIQAPATWQQVVAQLSESMYHRFAVAWGLSYPEPDLGKVSRPSDSPDVQLRERYDWGHNYIGKEMV